MVDLLGTDHRYAADPFIEMPPVETDPVASKADAVQYDDGTHTQVTLNKGGGTTGGNAGGRYMIHCHNLPHEDHDMMQQFAVGDAKLNDPITSAPCPVLAATATCTGMSGQFT